MSESAYINGDPYAIDPSESILAFARRHLGHDSIPTLCDAPNLKPGGSCRVCSVEVSNGPDAPPKVVASCHTPVEPGMHIHTDSERIDRLRYNLVELIVTDHPLDCLTCDANGNCELQDVAARVGLHEVRYPPGETHLDVPKDSSHVYMRADLSKCINCYRCVRACDQVQGEFVLSTYGRGFDARIIMGADQSFADSPCVACGACSQTCPTAAISDIFKPHITEATAPPTRTVCTYCGVGCNLDVYTRDDEVLAIQAPDDAEVNAGHLCLKGRYAFRFYNHPDRLRSPLIRRNGELEPATWDEAMAHIADRLAEIRGDHGPDAIAAIMSARCTNEENFLMQKFMRAVVGTNNVDGCARVCHAPTAYGMQQSFGTGAATNSIDDIQQTDLILVIGANPSQSHPVTGAKIKQAAIQGTPLIVIDPMAIELTEVANWHLQLRPGSNVAMLNMLARFIIDENLVDETFVAERCEGFETLREEIRKLDIDELERITGVDRDLVREAAIAYASAPCAMAFHGLGITEHSQGSKGVMLLANLAMMTGNVGIPGAGLNPLRGQNNVQGAADMGVQPNQGTGYLDVTDPEVQKHYQSAYGAPVPPKVGYTITEMFAAARSNELRAMWIVGEDVVQTDAHSADVVKALDQLDFLVVQELFLTHTARRADVVLPGASFLEKSGTFTNGERRVQRVNRAVSPLDGARPDGEIIVDIMNRMGYAQPPYDAPEVLSEVAEASPAYVGADWNALGDNGKQWPITPDGQDTKILHVHSFKRGKGAFHFYPYEKSHELADHEDEYPYILTTGRTLVHYNCGTMTRRTLDREIVSEDLLYIHPKDAATKNVHTGDTVELTSPRAAIRLTAKISEEVTPGVLFTTFHFPDELVNLLTSDETDAESLCPEYKIVAVKLEKLDTQRQLHSNQS